MNEFIKKFSQYFNYGESQIAKLYLDLQDYGAPFLVRNPLDIFHICVPLDKPPYFLLAEDPAEANEIYERIINFYNENIKEK